MDTCKNCGAPLPAGARFCPSCAAPVAKSVEAAAADPEAKLRGRRLAASIAFAVLIVLNLAVITFAVLVFGFGMFVDG